MKKTAIICILLFGLLFCPSCKKHSSDDTTNEPFHPQPVDYAWSVIREFDDDVDLRSLLSDYSSSDYVVNENFDIKQEGIVKTFTIFDFKTAGSIFVHECTSSTAANEIFASKDYPGAYASEAINLFMDSYVRVGRQIVTGSSVLVRDLLLKTGLEIPSPIPVPNMSNTVIEGEFPFQHDTFVSFLKDKKLEVNELPTSEQEYTSLCAVRDDGMVMCSVRCYPAGKYVPDINESCDIYSDGLAVGRTFVIAKDTSNTYVITYLDGVADDFFLTNA